MSLRKNAFAFGLDAIRDPRPAYEARIARDLSVRYDSALELGSVLGHMVCRSVVDDEPYEDDILALKHIVIEDGLRIEDMDLTFEQAVILRALLPDEVADQ